MLNICDRAYVDLSLNCIDTDSTIFGTVNFLPMQSSDRSRGSYIITN